MKTSLKETVYNLQQADLRHTHSVQTQAEKLGIDLEQLPEDWQNHPLFLLGKAVEHWMVEHALSEQRDRHVREITVLRDLLDNMLENIPQNQ